jgi:aryl carrier-like protein
VLLELDRATVGEVEAILPLVASQKGILAESADGTGRYVGQQVIELYGPLSVDRLRDVWREVCQLHQALRSTFHAHDSTFVQVVRSRVDASMRTFDLTVLHETDRDHAVQALTDEERERGIDLVGGPPVRLTLFKLGDARHFLCLTHHHAAIDGRSLSVVLDDVARAYDGVALASARPSLVEVVRRLVHVDLALERTGALASGEMGIFGPPMDGTLTQTELRFLDSTAISAAATGHGVTPASVCISAWLLALAELRGDDDPTCCLSSDRRPASLPGAELVVGMFTETLFLAAPSFRPRSAADGAARVLDLLLSGGGPPALADGLGPARRAGASGRPDVLLTVYSSADLPPPPSGLTWRLAAASEATEFAVDATIHLGAEPRLELAYDMYRASRDDARKLARRVAVLLEDPLGGSAGASEPRRSRMRGPRQPSDAEVVDRLVVVATKLSGRAIEPDEDLVASGWESLALLELAVALSAAGADVRVGDLVELGTLARVADRSAARTRGDAAGAESAGTFPSPIESGLLARSRDRTLGEAPLHEQSILVFDTPLVPSTLEEAFDACLRRFPSLDRWWEDGEPHRLAPRGDRPLWFASQRAPEGQSVSRIALEVAARDLEHPFEPGCGSLVRLHLVHDGRSSAVVLSFHYAVLDGWSFGTFVRSLQDAYLEPGRVRGVGSDSTAYRLRGALDVEGRHPWSDWLADVSPMPSPSTSTGVVRSFRVAAALDRAAVDALVRRLSVSRATVVQALAAQSARRVLDYPERRWSIALRMSVRDGSAGAGIRAVGQLTTDVPLSSGEVDLPAAAEAVVRARRLCLGASRVGFQDFEEAIGCSADEVVSDTAIVIENYLRLDELLTRHADNLAWPEASTWRRDVSPTWRTLTFLEEEHSWSLDLRTVIDDDSAELAGRLVTEMARVIEEELR